MTISRERESEREMGSLPHLVEDLQGFLQVYSDGSISRPSHIDFNIPVIENASVSWKDRLYDKIHNLHLRLYKPSDNNNNNKITNLPIVYYIHGGGFCVGSRTWPNCHNCCLRLASGLNAIVIAPDYRLAPEHRLPAAIDDSLSAVKWLQRQASSKVSDRDEWLAEGVNFDRVYILGDSSGGNVAHHLAVRLGSGSIELAPVRVRGYVLMAPFFGGLVRTRSEAEGPYEGFLNLEILDRFWRLSIPFGATRDHPIANPFGPESPNLEPLNLDPILIIVGGSEVMKERIEEYARRMKGLRKKIEYVEFEGKQHGFFTNDPFSDVSNGVVNVIQGFIFENSG